MITLVIRYGLKKKIFKNVILKVRGENNEKTD